MLETNDLFAKRYRLVKLLGVGGYSQVWLAEDTIAGNLQVAIKVFAPDKGLDSDGVEILSKEFTLVFNLNHAGLLKPMHYDVFDSSPYLVLQYCSRGSMVKLIGNISEAELARFLHQAAAALHYLHSQQPPIIHQDIKPDNFLIDNQGNYLLADFGISSKIRRTLTKSMGTAASGGTMAYMPPEKFSADRLTVKAGDVFSLGVSLYELLTGDWPYGANGGITLKNGADVPNLPDGFSAGLNDILRRCLARDTWNRPTAIQLQHIAALYLQSGQWHPLPASPGDDSEPTAPPTATPPPKSRDTRPLPPHKIPGQGQPNPAPPPKPGKTRKMLLLLTAVIVIALGVWFISNTQRHKQIAEQESIAFALREQQIADSVATVRGDSVAKVREAESLAAIREAERQAWQTAANANTIAAYDGYLRDYPTGENAARARERKAQLEAQSRFASYTENTAGLNLRMVAVKGGAFTMGCTAGQGSDCNDREKPAHRVTVGDYYIGKYEVTVAQFKQFIDETNYSTDADKEGKSWIWTGSSWNDKSGVNWEYDVNGNIRPQSDFNHPVIHVSWNDAVEFGKWLSRTTGKRYRLPTEAEWEYAARGGNQCRDYKYAGSNNIDEVAEYQGNNNKSTKPVGGKKANELGLYDMTGNVWEWCEDDWHGNYKGAPTDGRAWVDSPRGSIRVLRGGSWNNLARYCRVSARYIITPGNRLISGGFRLACFP
jgi:formylglycine-generating enzyme required for sulfatase activity/serine/threonine protein kinase